MREITVKLYQYGELSDKAKEKAREWFREGYDGYQSWEYIKEDATNIGLEIESLDQHRANRGGFVTSAPECIEDILANHGKDCETYKTAKKYEETFQVLEGMRDKDDPKFEDEFEKAEHEFLHDLLEDYRIMLDREIECQNSDEVVAENIEANEYEFTENGKRA